jgi:RNA polymerase sigma-70 factor (ECF subfamily)
LVQETYLRAWRAYHGFEQRSSLRTWMYRIATNACLTALEQYQRRPLPTGLGAPSSDPADELRERPEVPWLEPLPDALVWGEPPADPAEQVVTRESVRLAFVAALQLLTPRQRAAVILRDVLGWQASEVADALGVSVAAVNSALQRGRAQLAKHRMVQPDELTDQRARELLDSYLAAFEDYDIDRIVSLLTEDAVWEMPPFTGWYRGAADIGRLIAQRCPAKGPGALRLLPTSANGQPVFAVYLRDDGGVARPFQLQQLTVTEAGVAHVACYFDLRLFAAFGLPETL